jgi:release factor glutamine methyltransferase
MAAHDVSQLISEASRLLAAAGVDSPRLDAEIMLAAAAGSSRTAVVAELAEIDDAVRQRYLAMISRRVQREPLAYILKCKEFYSLEFEVTPAVLIPRPETEVVVQAALESIAARHPDPAQRTPSKSNSGRQTILDIGTGSGAIALAIAANAAGAQLTATDISIDALEVAGRNAVRLHLLRRVEFRLADCFEPLDDLGSLGHFGLIVANPPYISEGQLSGLASEVSRYEPRAALSGGADGLAMYRRIASGLPAHLEPNGTAILEIGSDQSASVAEILRNSGASAIEVISDLAGLPRVIVAQFN